MGGSGGDTLGLLFRPPPDRSSRPPHMRTRPPLERLVMTHGFSPLTAEVPELLPVSFWRSAFESPGTSEVADQQRDDRHQEDLTGQRLEHSQGASQPTAAVKSP